MLRERVKKTPGKRMYERMVKKHHVTQKFNIPKK